MNREKAIEIVRKCLLLAEHNNSLEEAKTAALKAQELMAKFSIENAELTLQQKQVVHRTATNWGRIPLWKKALASIIAPNYRCFWYIQSRNGESIIIFCGLEGEVELAHTVFKHMVERITVAYQEYEQTKRKEKQGLVSDGNIHAYNMLVGGNSKNDFIFGYLEGLRDSFHKQTGSSELAIIASLPAIVQKEFNNLRLYYKKEKGVSSAGNQVAHDKGRELGGSGVQ